MGKKTWKVGLDRKGKDFRRFIREGDDLDSVLQALREEYPEYKGGGSMAQVAEEGEDLDEWLKLPGSQWHKGVNDKPDYEVVNDFSIDAIKDNFTPPGAKSQKEKVKDEIDTNDNGEIEVDEMADFQKSLDDYASKNKKGRDDIPVTTRR